ncbi:hypothetical protein [Nostoc sp. PCC 9305]
MAKSPVFSDALSFGCAVIERSRDSTTACGWRSLSNSCVPNPNV